jgi:hypothetical protein
VAADRQEAVGVALGVQGLGDGEAVAAVGHVVIALAPLVADHLLLVLEARLVEQVEQVAHAVALEPQRRLDLMARHDLEVVGAVGVGGAVDPGAADLLQHLEVHVLADVLGPLEHHVLEEVGKSALAGRLVAAADVVPNIGRHQRHRGVPVQDHLQAVVQSESLVLDVDRRLRRGGRSGAEDEGEGQQQGVADHRVSCAHARAAAPDPQAPFCPPTRRQIHTLAGPRGIVVVDSAAVGERDAAHEQRGADSHNGGVFDPRPGRLKLDSPRSALVRGAQGMPRASRGRPSWILPFIMQPLRAGDPREFRLRDVDRGPRRIIGVHRARFCVPPGPTRESTTPRDLNH